MTRGELEKICEENVKKAEKEVVLAKICFWFCVVAAVCNVVACCAHFASTFCQTEQTSYEEGEAQ